MSCNIVLTINKREITGVKREQKFLRRDIIFATVTGIFSNGTARLKRENNCMNTNIHSYSETSGVQRSNQY
jgi:hypothetical protein